jgi:hypothetical protein
MRFQNLLRGTVGIAVLLLATSAAAAMVVTPLPDPQYNISLSVGIDSGFVGGVNGTAPGNYQVGCTSQTGPPFCASAVVGSAPSPSILANAAVNFMFAGQRSEVDVTIKYYYAVDCDTCAPGTLVPLQMNGYLQFDYTLGAPYATLQGGGASVGVGGFDTVHGFDGSPMVDVSVSPGGVCQTNHATGTVDCRPAPASAFNLAFVARVNTAYQVQVSEATGVLQGFGSSQMSTASSVVDPVISFAPGFDSTGYSIAVSQGIGNEAAGVPEPAPFALIGLAAAAGVLFRRIRVAR